MRSIGKGAVLKLQEGVCARAVEEDGLYGFGGSASFYISWGAGAEPPLFFLGNFTVTRLIFCQIKHI